MNEEFAPALRMLTHEGERCQLVCIAEPSDDYAEQINIIVVAPNGSICPVASIRTVDEACDFGEDEDLDNARDEENRSLGDLFASAPRLLDENNRLSTTCANLVFDAEQALWWLNAVRAGGWIANMKRDDRGLFDEHLESLTKTINAARGADESTAQISQRVLQEARDVEQRMKEFRPNGFGIFCAEYSEPATAIAESAS